MDKPKNDQRPDPSGTEGPGEGDHAADRRYRDATKRFVDSGAVGPAAEEARRAVDDPEESEELDEAVEIGKSHRADK